MPPRARRPRDDAEGAPPRETLDGVPAPSPFLLLRPTDAADVAGEGVATLRDLRSRVSQFMSTAASAPPPVPLESADDAIDANDDADDGADVHVDMKLLLGVLERKDPSLLPQRTDGLLLPTRTNRERLAAAETSDATAFLNMAMALAATRTADGASDSDDSGVAICDADDYSTSSSDDDGA